MRLWLYAVVAVAWFPALLRAEPAQQLDGLGWLKKVAAAAHQSNYTGTFIYQYGSHVETTRIVHLKDETGEHEKLESLDGPPREIVRSNDEVLCYQADSTSVVVEKKKLGKSFPALLPGQLGSIAENYYIRLGEQDRVAGYPCQVIVLEPKDRFRYRQKFWAENASGLLLKAVTMTEKNEVVDQISFTQVTIGGQIDRELLKPKLAGRKVIIQSEQLDPAEQKKSESAWVIAKLPPGFEKVATTRRLMPGKDKPVTHMVFSDGLAALSVFIEPIQSSAKPAQGLSKLGGLHMYSRPVANHQVTVLGEVPAETVMQVGNSIGYNPEKAGVRTGR
jgi:sigma-E factor negative regulatory protein RseB